MPCRPVRFFRGGDMMETDLLDGILDATDKGPEDRDRDNCRTPSAPAAGSRHYTYDVDEIKRLAEGRWLRILPAMTGIPADVLDGKHHAVRSPVAPISEEEARLRVFADFRDMAGASAISAFQAATDSQY